MQFPRASPPKSIRTLAFLIVAVALLVGALLLGTHGAQASDVPATADQQSAVIATDVDPGGGTEAILLMSLANADIDASASTAFDDLIAASTDGAGLYATVTLLAAVLLVPLASFILLIRRHQRSGPIPNRGNDPSRWNLVGQLFTWMHRARDLALGMGRVALNPS